VARLREQKKVLRKFVLAGRDGLSRPKEPRAVPPFSPASPPCPRWRPPEHLLLCRLRQRGRNGAAHALGARHHKALGVPLIVGPGQMESRQVTDPDRDLAPGNWQIPEPDKTCPR